MQLQCVSRWTVCVYIYIYIYIAKMIHGPSNVKPIFNVLRAILNNKNVSLD